MTTDTAAAAVTEASGRRKITLVGMAGLTIGLLALAAAVLSPWLVDALEPDRKSVDQVATERAVSIKDRIARHFKGEKPAPPPEPEAATWSKRIPFGVTAAGMLAICIGVVGLVARHDGRLNTSTIAVGSAAIVFQYVLIVAAAILVILLIGVILSSLGDVSV